MFIDLLVHTIWLAELFWIALVPLDYALTLLSARLYRAGVNQYLTFEGGIELNPSFQAHVNALRRFSPRYFVSLLISAVLVWLVWLFTVSLPTAPALLEFLLGALILIQAPIQLRHMRNVFFFREIPRSAALKGQIEYPRWLMLQQSFLDLIGFAVLFSFIARLTGRIFFVGGATSCFVNALRQRRYMWQVKSMRSKASSSDLSVTQSQL